MGWFSRIKGEPSSVASKEEEASLRMALELMAQDGALLDPVVVVRAVDCEDALLRVLAIKVAVKHQYVNGAKLCTRLLFDESDAVLHEAIRGLEVLGDASCLPHLRRLTYSEDPDIALSAMEAMRSLQAPEAHQAAA